MTQQRRRPGPRTDLDVRTRLLDVAEQLFADSPPETVSMRAVARHAGVAPAALKHYFPNKDALVEAVVLRRAPQYISGAEKLLDELEKAGAEVSPRQWVEAVIMPLVEIVEAEPVGGSQWMKIFLRLGLASHPIYVREIQEASGLSDRFLHAAMRALPNLSRREVSSRIGIAVFALFSALLSIDIPQLERPSGPGRLDRRFVERLLVFTSAGLTGA